ncbi:MAG: ABC transporter transmembrane domain-containing protein [Phycisphaerales bacterium]
MTRSHHHETAEPDPQARRSARLLPSVFSWRGSVVAPTIAPSSPAFGALLAAFLHLQRPTSSLSEVGNARSIREAVEGIGVDSGLLIREVDLAPAWWRTRGEPLLVEHCTLGPCFVFHRRGRWHGRRMLDQGGTESIRVDAAFAAECGERAHECLRMPPAGPIRIRDLVGAAMAERWSDLGLRVLAACIAAAIGVVIPLMTALVIDSVIPNGDLRGLVGVAAALMVAISANSLLLLIAGQATLRLDNSLAYRIESIVLARELGRSQSASALSAGEIVQRVTGVNYAMKQLTDATNTVLVQIVSGFSNLFVLFLFNWVYGIIGVVTAGATLAVMLTDALIQRRFALASENAFGRAKAASIRILDGIDAAQDRGITERLVRRWESEETQASGAAYRSASVSNARSLVNLLIGSAARVLMFAIAAYPLVDGLTLGAFIASLAAFTAVTAAVAQLGTLVGTAALVEPIFARLRPLLDGPAPPPGGGGWPEPLGAFRVDAPPLNEGDSLGSPSLSFEIEPDRLTVIVAERPAMAHRLLGMFTGMESSDGRVLIDETPVDRLGPRSLLPRLTSLVSTPGILPGTVRRNLDPKRRFDDETLLAALATVNCALSLDDVLDPRRTSTSVAAALAAVRLSLEPRRVAVIVDHAAMQERSDHRRAVQNLAGRTGTRVVASNAPDVVAMADRVVVLDERGRIVADGPPGEIAHSQGLPVPTRSAFR